MDILKPIKDKSMRGYNDDKPYWWHNYDSTNEKRKLINDILSIAWEGKTDENKYCIKFYDWAKKSFKNKQELADTLIDMHTYSELNWQDFIDGTQEQKARLRTAIDNYQGLDAFVEAAKLEFIANIDGDYADIEAIIELFNS